jgi:hypothetical protein
MIGQACAFRSSESSRYQGGRSSACSISSSSSESRMSRTSARVEGWATPISARARRARLRERHSAAGSSSTARSGGQAGQNDEGQRVSAVVLEPLVGELEAQVEEGLYDRGGSRHADCGELGRSSRGVHAAETSRGPAVRDEQSGVGHEAQQVVDVVGTEMEVGGVVEAGIRRLVMGCRLTDAEQFPNAVGRPGMVTTRRRGVRPDAFIALQAFLTIAAARVASRPPLQSRPD